MQGLYQGKGLHKEYKREDCKRHQTVMQVDPSEGEREKKGGWKHARL